MKDLEIWLIFQHIFNRYLLTRYGNLVSILARSPCIYKKKGLMPEFRERADSSAGRASALQAEGHRFEPCSAYHQY